MKWRALVSASLLFLSGLFAGLLVLTVEPNLWVKVGELVSEEPERVDAEKLVFSEEQVDALNKVYREREDEYGYCLKPRRNDTVGLRHPLSVNRSNSTSIRFSCPGDYSGLLHTHPGPDAVAGLSMRDKLTLVNGSMEFSCVLAGTIPESVERSPYSLPCYQDPYGDRDFESRDELEEAVREAEFLSIPVRIQ